MAGRKAPRKKESKSPGSSKKEKAVVVQPSDNGTQSTRHTKRDELAQELLLELREMRANLDELTEHYRLRIAGEHADITQTLEGKGLQPKPKRPTAKLTQAMLNEIRRRPIKPKKGRAKDLVKLQDIVRSVAMLLPPED